MFLPFSLNQKLTLAHQQMTADYEKMRQEEAEISAKLQERMSVAKSGRRNGPNGRVLVRNNASNSGAGGCGVTNPVVEGDGGGDDEVDKHWWICDKAIVTEEDKRRLFGVIMNAKRRKEMLNLSQKHLKQIEAERHCGIKADKNKMNKSRRDRGSGVGDEVVKKRNFKGLVRDVLEQLPFALPTLQLHIILSLTMVLLTHQCPVASYFIAV